MSKQDAGWLIMCIGSGMVGFAIAKNKWPVIVIGVLGVFLAVYGAGMSK